jgi:Putative zinc-finger
MHEAGSHEATCPPDVLALIPWYPDGTLSASERGTVEAHAATCTACREEIHALLGGFEAPAHIDVPPATEILARVLDRIDQSEAAGPTGRGLWRRRPGMSSVRPARRSSQLGQRLALAATLVLAAGVGALATLALPRVFGQQVVYRAATASETTAASASGPLLEIIPRDDVSAAQLRTALRKVEGELVGGPEGTLGRYRVRLPAGADAAAAAAILRAEDGGIASYAEALRL